VRIVSRRGAIEAPAHVTTALRPGLAFMTFHFPDEVETNRITNEAYDPKSGTSEFKATAIRVERLTAAVTG
jgi:formate dehydrogenase major subunit